MDTATFRLAAIEILPRWAAYADELRDLDAALGDGDLGITVSSGATAALAAIEGAEDGDLSALWIAAGRAFATANPSTFAALAGGGLLAAGASLRDVAAFDRAAAVTALRALAQRIMDRGKAQRGDKTVLDALLPSIEALEAAAPEASAAVAVDAMRRAAWEGVDATRDSVSQRGRAAWVGERGAGHSDPGATAYARLLDETVDWVERRR